MIATIYPGKLSGSLSAIPSKSHVHRLLICAAFARGETRIACPALNEDIEATARCLRALGARIEYRDESFIVNAGLPVASPTLDVGESGSTYRFLFPVAAALGVNAAFRLHGRLPSRPMLELAHAVAAHGAVIEGIGGDTVRVGGRLTPGIYELPGDVSSQYISALIFALPLTGGDCVIRLTTPVESRGYINMTLDAVRAFGIDARWEDDRIVIPGGQAYVSPGAVTAEGDWSNAAFLLCAAAAADSLIDIEGLNLSSAQGDMAVMELIRGFGSPPTGFKISLADIPDLAPALAVLAAAAHGETRMVDAARLKLKESDRIAAITEVLRELGADAECGDDFISVRGGRRLRGGVVDSRGDHRIVMMAACAAVISDGPVTINRAEAVGKSYPRFFDDIRKLGLKADIR